MFSYCYRKSSWQMNKAKMLRSNFFAYLEQFINMFQWAKKSVIQWHTWTVVGLKDFSYHLRFPAAKFIT